MANFLKSLFVKGVEIDPAGATSDQVLKYNGTKFVPGTASTVGSIDDLTDVIITSPLEYESLVYNGTNWVNQYASNATYVRNAEATTLTTGTVVYLFGATGDHATVKRADNDSDTTSAKTVGLVASPIAASENGPVVTRGYVDGINLSTGYSSGDILWLGEDGAFTKVKPTAPEHLVFIGVVVRATNNGIVYVATQNGYELDELHNVSLPSPQSGEFLKYNGTLWVADAIDLGTDTTGNYMSGVSVQNGLTVSHTPGEGSSATIGVDNALLSNFLLDGASGNSYGLIGTSAYLDVKNTNGYNKEIELDIAAVETQLNTDGYITGTVHDSRDHSTAMASVVIDDISDVSVSSPTAGQVLTYNGSLWTAASAGGGASITVSDTPPVSPAAGALWFESDSGLTFIYYDSQWIEIGAGASYDPITGIVQAKGDLILGTASQTVDRLGVGTDSQRLIANSSASTGVSWASDSTNTVIDTKGDLLVGATNDVVAKLPVGTDNQVLVADSTATNGVSWQSRPLNLPWGVMAYYVATGNSAISTVTTDITGTSLTFTATANRLYRAIFVCDYSQNTANAIAGFYLANASGTLLNAVANTISVANGFAQISMTHLFTTTAGSTTRKMMCDLSTGTGSIRGTGGGGGAYSFIIEDIGPA